MRTSIEPLTLITVALECINAIFQSELASVVILQRRSRLALHQIHRHLLRLPPPSNRGYSGSEFKKVKGPVRNLREVLNKRMAPQVSTDPVQDLAVKKEQSGSTSEQCLVDSSEQPLD
ncbi:hypothetical protein P879_01468 [Paragonimus westermani]|uniref:Uncharacterized protein n=1 Tax=Paragonimus westermani TaxID=34504 RepID=A0A8T0DRD3_9TREM|nr:hypothetical protein P879_01468 [Paragonimus westermani]